MPSCQPGHETAVCDAALRKVLKKGFNTGVRAVLHRAEYIPGFVYVEAPAPADIAALFEGINFVLRSSHRATQYQRIPPDERAPLLRLKDTDFPSPPSPGTWARIQKPGRYHDDLVYVGEVDPTERSIAALFIPRIHQYPPKKRGPRAEREVFNPDKIRALGIGEWRNKAWGGQGLVIPPHGLGSRTMKYADLTWTNVQPLESDLEPFRACAYPPAQLLALRDGFLPPFNMWEAVKVVDGPCLGVIGVVSEISSTEISITTNPSPAHPQVILTLEHHHVRKLFQLYDFTEVVYGKYQGSFGFLMRYEPTLLFPGPQPDEFVAVLWVPNLKEYVSLLVFSLTFVIDQGYNRFTSQRGTSRARRPLKKSPIFLQMKRIARA